MIFLYVHDLTPRSRNNLDLQCPHIFIYAIRCQLLLPFRSLAAIVSATILHTTFRGNRPTGFGEEDFLRVFTIYGRGGNPGHVTSIMSLNFYFLVPESFHTKLGSEPHISF